MVDSLARLCRLGFQPQLFRLRLGIVLTRVSIRPACRLERSSRQVASEYCSGMGGIVVGDDGLGKNVWCDQIQHGIRAGEGAMPPQLPTSARRLLKIAELRDRFQQQIRSGSKLRRGVIKRKQVCEEIERSARQFPFSLRREIAGHSYSVFEQSAHHFSVEQIRKNLERRAHRSCIVAAVVNEEEEAAVHNSVCSLHLLEQISGKHERRAH
nr:hypothetical protein Iba_chr05cCG12270 [Ipomoea batatas]